MRIPQAKIPDDYGPVAIVCADSEGGSDLGFGQVSFERERVFGAHLA